MREQEQKLANVKKSCDVVRKVSKVFSIAIIVAAVLTLISAIGLLAAKDQINSNLVFDQATRQIYAAGDPSGFVTMEDVAVDVEKAVQQAEAQAKAIKEDPNLKKKLDDPTQEQ